MVAHPGIEFSVCVRRGFQDYMRLGKPCCTKSAVFFNIVQTGGGVVIPMFKNFDVKYVTFKGPFGSIN